MEFSDSESEDIIEEDESSDDDDDDNADEDYEEVNPVTALLRLRGVS